MRRNKWAMPAALHPLLLTAFAVYLQKTRSVSPSLRSGILSTCYARSDRDEAGAPGTSSKSWLRTSRLPLMFAKRLLGRGSRMAVSTPDRGANSLTVHKASSSALAQRENPRDKKAVMVFVLVAINVVVFLLDKLTPFNLVGLYLDHRHPALHQFVTSTFCHANPAHLSGNLFPLLVFGKLVEEELGGLGLLLSYLFIGVASGIASVIFLPSNTLGLGASGAVFGLFTLAVMIRVSIRDFSWRSTLEAAIYGQYVWEKLKSEVAITAKGGIMGVNHVAHLGGAAAGVAIVLVLRLLLALFEDKDGR